MATPEHMAETAPVESEIISRTEDIWHEPFREWRFDISDRLVTQEEMRYSVKYGNLILARILDRTYEEWKKAFELDTRRSHSRRPFEPERDLAERGRPELPTYPEQNLNGLPPVKELFNVYNALRRNPDAISSEELAAMRNLLGEGYGDATAEQAVAELLSRYFKEFKKQGLLDAADSYLNKLAQRVIEETEDPDLDTDEIITGAERSPGIREQIGHAADIALRIAKAAGIITEDLLDVVSIYIESAENKLLAPLIGRERGIRVEPPPVEGEFRYDASKIKEKDKEIYWRPLYADYFEVTARTRKQFDIAVESFISWVRRGLGKAPDEIFNKVRGFVTTLTAAGKKAGLEEYTVEKKLQLEVLAAVIGASFSNEQYNADYFKQFWTFGAQHQGPERMLQLIKSNKGILAAVLWKFDKDRRLDLLFEPHGTRGQLMKKRNAQNMGDLEDHIKERLVWEVMGISLKRYHPGDPEMRMPDDNSMFDKNLDEITKFKSDEDFKDLYEGFDLAEQKRLLEQLSAKPEGELRPVERDLKKRLERAKKVREHLEAGKGGQKGEEVENIRRVLGKDEADMYEEAKNIVTLAFELYGAMGEKARREGGVFIVHRRNIDGSRKKDSLRRNVVDYLPVQWAQTDLHFVENWTKATYGAYGEDLDPEIKARLKQEREPTKRPEERSEIYGILADELKYRVGQNRRWATWGLKTFGAEAKLWDFALFRNGRPVDPNTLGYTKYGVSPDPRYTDDPIERYKYADPVNIRVLGYNSRGEDVILVFDDEGKPVEGVLTGLEFDPVTGKPIIYDQREKIATILDVDKYGVETPRQRGRQSIEFDNLTRATRARRMMLKRPKVRRDEAGKLVKVDGEPVYDGVESIHVDYETIKYELASHPYARWTGNPYWGYQEEDPGLLLADESVEAARKIRRGELRPEDAPPHAVQLLIVDPTLENIRHFDDLENVECLLGLAAVEESYQAHWRIGDELYANFYPEDGSRLKTRVQYVLQDRGGATKQWFHGRAEAAYWPDARARRLRYFLPFIPLHFASMSEMWGAPGGALDVFRMMGYEKYRMVGQFAFDKLVNQTGSAQDLAEALTLDPVNEQQKKIDEALGRKLNNEADVHLKAHHHQVSDEEFEVERGREDSFEKFLMAVRESLYRMERVEHRGTVLESLRRGERAPLWLEGIDKFKRGVDGRYELDEDGNRLLNDKIDSDRDSGSSRHSNKIFHYRFVRFIRSERYRIMYPDTARYYAIMDQRLVDYPRLAEEAANLTGRSVNDVTGWDWLEGKMNN